MDRDKFLTAAMGGKKVNCCVVELENVEDIDESCVMQETNDFLITDCIYGKYGGKPEECEYWQQRIKGGITDFSTWEGFGKLWEWAIEQEWIGTFISTHTTPYDPDNMSIWMRHINPTNFADAIYDYLTKEGK